MKEIIEGVRIGMSDIHIVKYADQYLKRKFLDWTDLELKRERIACLRDASMIKAEMERRERDNNKKEGE